VHATATNTTAQSGSTPASSRRFVVRPPGKMAGAPAASLIRLIWSIFPLITVLLSSTEANRQAVVSYGCAASCRVVNKVMSLSNCLSCPFQYCPAFMQASGTIVTL
jgi:hypothetical protein